MTTIISDSVIFESAGRRHHQRYRYAAIRPGNEFSGGHRYVFFVCIKCGRKLTTRLDHHLDGEGCLSCYPYPPRSASITFEDALVRGTELYLGKYEYLELIPNSRRHKRGKLIRYRCVFCHKTTTQSLASHLSGAGCKCKA